MTTLYLKVEGRAGATFPEVFVDLATLASRLGIGCCMDANGVEVIAHPGDTGAALHEGYTVALKHHHKVAVAWR